MSTNLHRKEWRALLILGWSPEQISGWLKTRYAYDESIRVSHETMFRSLFIQHEESAYCCTINGE